MKIINYEKKKEIILTNEEKESYENQKVCYICEKEFCTDKNNEKDFKLKKKLKIIVIIQENLEEPFIRYKIPKEIPVVFHNRSTYDYQFIIEQLAREFKGYFHFLGENTEKHITFYLPIKKVLDNDNDNDKAKNKAKHKVKTVTHKLKSIDSYRFTQDSLSNLVDNLSRINNKVSEVDKKISHASLIEKFPNTYQLCNKDLNKLALLLRKGVYPYDYMDSWKRFKEESLPDKESFYSELNNEHITDEDYAHAQKVWDMFKIKNLGEYHDLYVQSDTSLLADVFENFRNKCIEIYELDPAHFLSAPGLAWQACLKKTGVKLELLTDNDMLTMVENIRGRMCNAVYRHAKANKYMKNYHKNTES